MIPPLLVIRFALHGPCEENLCWAANMLMFYKHPSFLYLNPQIHDSP